MSELTESEMDIMHYLLDRFLHQNGTGCDLGNIQRTLDVLGIEIKGVPAAIDALQERGWIKKEPLLGFELTAAGLRNARNMYPQL